MKQILEGMIERRPGEQEGRDDECQPDEEPDPWHCIAEHRPLGNQSRARRRMYFELSKLRHDMNAEPHYEPTGDETF